MSNTLRAALGSAALLLSCQTTETPKPAAKTEPVAVAKPAPAAPAKPAPALEPLPVSLETAAPLPAQPKGLPPVDFAALGVTPERAELGWHLFFETRLSKDNSQSCATCHHIDKAYTSGLALDPKVGGALNKRNAPTVLNLAFHSNYYWDGRMPTLEAVSLAAWKGQLGADPEVVTTALNQNGVYRAEFKRAYGLENITSEAVTKALAAFFRVLQNGNAPFDQFIAGDKAAMSPTAQQGWAVFQKAQCVSCHVPPLFSDFGFHNVGIGDDPGRKDATKADADVGKFKTPSLRNVALSGPYFHDGKTATLDEAIALMAKGGNANANLDPLLKNQKLSAKDLAAVKAFLEALTGTSTYTIAPEPPEPVLNKPEGQLK